MGNVCRIEGCSTEAGARGYCKSHYETLRKKGVFDNGNPKRKCSVEGCNGRHLANGYCSKHDAQMRLYGRILDRTVQDRNKFILDGDICRIKLYNAKNKEVAEAIIDAEDYEKCKDLKWYLTGTGYVLSGHRPFLHHLVFGRKVQLDHKDRNPLNNRKNNLRICTTAENSRNSRVLRCSNTSGYKGVSWSTAQQKWTADITFNYKHIYLGAFTDPKQAAAAYNAKAVELHGEFAQLNSI